MDPSFDWADDRRPETPWHRTILYEMHVKGFTKLHPEIPPGQRGTYAGLASEPALDYLQRLGVTAVELLPVHQFVHDERLVRQGLRNYWGYNSIGFLAPHDEYCSAGGGGGQVREFKSMVKRLHARGIEVILDVVYNHTAEGNHLGPVLCFKGLDNSAYYKLEPGAERYYRDYTGTGNTLNVGHPSVLQLVMDSLRYWVQQMHVDGFRFDLASALARDLHEVNRLSAFFDLVQQDPVLNQVKLIAEPWDVGEGGYQVGNFPPLWSEWNGRYRDCMRDCWRGRQHHLPEFGFRLTGSSDLYGREGRSPFASINFVTSHDGFTLTDLVSYERKHNESNGEGNRDGTDDNRSWNCGIEGPTRDPAVLALRRRQRRNFLATLLLSQGVPMLQAGDELGRSQEGNNNAYCQDNELSWLQWTLRERNADLHSFVATLIEIRSSHRIFNRRHWFQDLPIDGSVPGEIAWFSPDGTEMSPARWESAPATSIGVFLAAREPTGREPAAERMGSFLLLINTEARGRRFALPQILLHRGWTKMLDTAEDEPAVAPPVDRTWVQVASHSLVVFRSRP